MNSLAPPKFHTPKTYVYLFYILDMAILERCNFGDALIRLKPNRRPPPITHTTVQPETLRPFQELMSALMQMADRRFLGISVPL